jgi:hypothetical protein
MTGLNNRTRCKQTEEVMIYTRQSPRYQTSIFSRVDGESSMCESRGNVSVGGFCFESDRSINPGTRVEVLFRLPGAGFWLKGYGEVLATEPRNDTLVVRGNFIGFDSGDADLLARWTKAIEHYQDGPAVCALEDQADPSEEILFSTTIKT